MANPSFQVKIKEDGPVTLVVHDNVSSVEKDTTYFQFDPKASNRFSFQRYPHSSGYAGPVVTAVITNQSPYNRQYGTLTFSSGGVLEWFSIEDGESKTVPFTVGAEYTVSFQPLPNRPVIEFVEIEAIKCYVAQAHLTAIRKESVVSELSGLDTPVVSDKEADDWFELLARNAAKWPSIEAGMGPFAQLVIECVGTMKQYADAILVLIKSMPSIQDFKDTLEALPIDQQAREAAMLSDTDKAIVVLIEESLAEMSTGLNVFSGAGEKFVNEINGFKNELENEVRPVLNKFVKSPQLKEALGPLSEALLPAVGWLRKAEGGSDAVRQLWSDTVAFAKRAESEIPTAQKIISIRSLQLSLFRAQREWKGAEKSAEALKTVLAMYDQA
ncbi:hypothetical protein [Pseudomonas donghuensis]|uniref:hypothetical protein n=1 Tax=Pseudomonas donghuensis TaxID=1163398 RepID=UPI0011D23F71|nr:hypothetical protein [Pseudomonas donghuensis]